MEQYQQIRNILIYIWKIVPGSLNNVLVCEQIKERGIHRLIREFQKIFKNLSTDSSRVKTIMHFLINYSQSMFFYCCFMDYYEENVGSSVVTV